MYCSIQEAWPEQKNQNYRTPNIEYFKEDINQDQEDKVKMYGLKLPLKNQVYE